MDPSLLQGLIGLGPGGIMAGIMLYLNKQDRADRAADRAERLQLDREETQAKEKLAKALTALSMKITGRPIDGDQA